MNKLRLRFETGAIHVEHKHWTPKTKTALNAHIYCLPLPWHVVSSHDPPENKPAPKKPKLGPGTPSRSTGFVLHWRRDRKPSPGTQSKEISRIGQAMRFQSTAHFPGTGSCLITFAARRKPKRLSCRWAANVALAKPRCARGTRAKFAWPTAAVTAAISTFEVEVLSRAPGGIGFTVRAGILLHGPRL